MNTTTKAKPLTKDAVLLVAQRLMLTVGQTSTLEVKLELRKKGYHALQDDVSVTMAELAKEEDWKVGDNGTHKLYAGQAIQAVLTSSLAVVAAMNNGSQVQVTPTAKKAAPVKTAKPARVISTNGATNVTANADGTIGKHQAKIGDWETNSVVGSTVLYFPAALGRDKARSRYAKITGTDRNDARARLVK